MGETTIRLAYEPDVDQLVEMRRDFTWEDPYPDWSPRAGYDDDCRAFLLDAIAGGRWHIWVAEVDGRIVAHAFVELIDRVPRPIDERAHLAYLTNVYTRPEFRGQGIGARVIRRAQEAAAEADVALMIVWPSDESVEFYEREGFEAPGLALVWHAPS
jgi:GNAT superfamily N-acetyltransferase